MLGEPGDAQRPPCKGLLAGRAGGKGVRPVAGLAGGMGPFADDQWTRRASIGFLIAARACVAGTCDDPSGSASKPPLNTLWVNCGTLLVLTNARYFLAKRNRGAGLSTAAMRALLALLLLQAAFGAHAEGGIRALGAASRPTPCRRRVSAACRLHRRHTCPLALRATWPCTARPSTDATYACGGVVRDLLLQGGNMPNQPAVQSTAPSIAVCCAYCRLNAACRAFTYVEATKQCVLKSAGWTPEARPGHQSAVLLVAPKSDPAPFCAAPGYCGDPLPGVEFQGGDLNIAKLDTAYTFEGCCDFCLRTPEVSGAVRPGAAAAALTQLAAALPALLPATCTPLCNPETRAHSRTRSPHPLPSPLRAVQGGLRFSGLGVLPDVRAGWRRQVASGNSLALAG